MPANKTNRKGRSRRPRRRVKRGETAVKVLLYDVESSPNLGWAWGSYEQNLLGIIKPRQIISFSWKWLGEKQVHVLALPDFKGYKKDPDSNRELMLRLHALFEAADVIVGHNIDNFDDKMANTDFIKNGLPPPPPHKTVDTLKVARRVFRFNSNKLDALGEVLGLGRKVKHEGFGLWIKCLEGCPKAWDRMRRYNKGDVVLLEKIYLKLRPWMLNHPNMVALDRHDGCPTCRSKNLMPRGWGLRGQTRCRRFRCTDCTKWCTGVMVANEWRFR